MTSPLLSEPDAGEISAQADHQANPRKTVAQPDIGPAREDSVTLCNRCHAQPKHGVLAWCKVCLNEASTPQRSLISFELTGEPRGKGRPRFTRAGIAYTPEKTRSYEAALRMAAQDAMGGRAPLEGPLCLTVEAHMPIPASWSGKQRKLAAAGARKPTGRPDFDNLLKPLDALNGVVWRDDAQVVDVRCVKLYSERPRLVVSVECVA